MPISDALLQEYDAEAANTRRVLERVPEDKFSWRPHAKSQTLGELANHLAEVPKWTAVTLTAPELDFAAMGDYKPNTYTSRADLLAAYDKDVAEARAIISKTSDDAWQQVWTMRKGDEIVLSAPRTTVMRSFIMNHGIHHRAQLGVYLRLNDVPVPSIYGPTADEQ
jgi:uncharacterized damage-inducible protein DinB